MAREPMTEIVPRRNALTQARLDGGEFDGRVFDVTRALGDIDLDDLRREVSECGGNAIWWGIISAAAASMVRRKKFAFEQAKSSAGKRLRIDHSRLGEKFTIDSIADEVATDKDVRAAEEDVIIAEEKAAVLRSVHGAVNEKQRTLGNLTGALARELNVSPDALRDRMVRGSRDGG